MIFTECVYCHTPFTVYLSETYMAFLEQNKILVERVVCNNCGGTNFVEHRTVGAETFGIDDPRAKELNKVHSS